MNRPKYNIQNWDALRAERKLQQLLNLSEKGTLTQVQERVLDRVGQLDHFLDKLDQSCGLSVQLTQDEITLLQYLGFIVKRIAPQPGDQLEIEFVDN